MDDGLEVEKPESGLPTASKQVQYYKTAPLQQHSANGFETELNV